MGEDQGAAHDSNSTAANGIPRPTRQAQAALPLMPNIRDHKPRPADTLVISLGSHAFRYGLAVDPTPKKLPAVVAFPRKKNTNTNNNVAGEPIRPIWAMPTATTSTSAMERFEKAKNEVVDILDMDSRRIGGGRPIPWDVEVELVTDNDKQKSKSILPIPPAAPVIITDNNNVIVGKPASMLLRERATAADYDIVAPIWDGKLIFGATDASDTLVRAALDHLLRHIARQVDNARANGVIKSNTNKVAVTNGISISANGDANGDDTTTIDMEMANGDCNNNNEGGVVYARRHVALVIPDTSDRRDVVEMVEAVFRVAELGTAAVFIHQGSIACALGAGLATCTVLDIGHTSTTISCIEDGSVLADSRVHLHYGARQMLAVFKRLLTDTAQFKNAVDKAHNISNSNYDVDHIATKACEQVCSFKAEENDRLFLGTVSTPDDKATFRVKVGLALRTLPAQGLLYPELLIAATTTNTNNNTLLPRRDLAMRHVPEDYFLELLYSPIKRNTGATAALPIGTFANVEKRDNNNSNIDIEDIPCPTSTSVVDGILWAVVQAAKASTVATTTPARFLSAIVLSGGAAGADGIAQTLEKLIKKGADSNNDINSINEVTVIDGGKGKNDDELAAARAILDKSKKRKNSADNNDNNNNDGSKNSNNNSNIQAADELDDSDTGSLPWKGGAVMIEADAVNGYWVYKDEWAARKVGVLRERVPFYW